MKTLQAPPLAAQYVLAAVFVALAALLCSALGPLLGPKAPLLAFVGPSVLAAAFGRIGPSLAATALSAVLATYLFVEPAGSALLATPGERTWIALFVLQNVALGALVASFQRARRHAYDVAASAGDASRLVEAIVASTPHAVIAADTKGTIRAWNRAAERIFGWRATDILGCRTPIVPPDEEANFAGLMRRAAAGETIEPFRAPRLRKDGTQVLCEITIAPLRDSAGAIYGIVATLTDVSRQSSLEEQLRQSQKMEAVGELAAGIAHDFNNQLTAILGYAQLAQYALPPGHELQPDLREIDRAAQNAVSLTRQLLAFSRRQTLHLHPVDVTQVVRDSEKLLRRTVREDITIHTLLGDETWITADAGQLQHILLNLVVNARDAMPEGGRIMIESRGVQVDHGFAAVGVEMPPGQYVTLAVSDTGVGMTRDVQARVFEPFFTTKEPGRGTGLGLAMVYGTVRQMGGCITVNSEPGHGATFKMYFPRVCRPGAVEIAGAAGSLRAGAGETVLLVDDDEGVRRLAAQTLTRVGYRVTEADTPAAALALARVAPAPFDLLIADFVMPGMNGPALAQVLVGHFGLKRVLYTSGYANQEGLQEQIARGAVQFLAKPFTPDELCSAVRSALESTRPAGQR